ncbi:MAG: DNA mismatch repair protein MutS, partial [Bdellovibrio sp.]
MAKLTPLMRQYWDIKSMYPGFLLFFRMGDFFELFHEDAQIVSQICGLHLTMRNKKAEDETRMCGLPHFSIAPHVNKLLALGHRVALCDQVEDPKLAKGLVKRAVTQILTPGMVYDPLTLDEKKPHHVVARDEQSIAWIDASSGEAGWMQVPRDEQESILALLNVVEEVRLEEVPRFDPEWEVFLGGASSPAIRNCLAWVARVQPQVLQYLEIFQEKLRQSGCYLSPTAAAHLEIFETSLGPEASLFRALDECRTPAGSRLLRQWLSFPLRDPDQIQFRLQSVASWRKDHTRLQAFRQSLSWIGDIERKLSRLASPQAMPIDLRNFAESILKLQTSLCFLDQGEILKEAAPLAEKLLSELREELLSSLSEAHLFRRGVSDSLDELMDLTENLQAVLAQLEKSEKELTGIG